MTDIDSAIGELGSIAKFVRSSEPDGAQERRALERATELSLELLGGFLNDVRRIANTLEREGGR